MDRILTNGLVLTMDAAGSRVDSIGVRDGRIVTVGDEADVQASLRPDATSKDLGGRTVIPGFIDAHNHFSNSVFEPIQVDCSTPPIDSLAEVLERIAAAAAVAQPGQWIRGWGYHWSRVHEERNPTRLELDEASPDHPAVIMDASYHGCFVNGRGLELAGIDRHTSPRGQGIIVSDPAGRWKRAHPGWRSEQAGCGY